MNRFPASPPTRSLPLWIWAAGYLEFLWHTLAPASAPTLGVLTLSSLALLTAWCVLSRGNSWLTDSKELLREWGLLRQESKFTAFAYTLAFLFLALTLLLGLLEASRPPHLIQEFDAIHYQMGVPRQLLLRQSLSWISWSVADLWPMAQQWGMAPLSLAFSTVNKFPQFLFTLGVAACLFRLPRQLAPQSERRLIQTIPMLAFLGAHGVVTQIGTGMMDLPLIYPLLLCLSALLDERYFTAAFALALYSASKSFNLFQVAPILVGGLGWLYFGRTTWQIRPIFTRFLPLYVAFTVALLARSSYVSLAATGTPLYPFAVCKISGGEFCTGAKAEIVKKNAATLLHTRYTYGNGRGALALLEHVWRVALPTNGVNNEFDYPLGLPWLLLMVLLAYSVANGGLGQPLFQLTLLFWALWWLNSHQSRWLYPVLAFGFLATLPAQRKARFALPALIALSSVLSFVSQYRAFAPTRGISAESLQAAEEAKVLWKASGTLESHELLYVKEPAYNHVPNDLTWVLR